jgi:hypothetical protein
MRRVHEVITADMRPLAKGSAILAGFTWRGTYSRVVRRQGILRPSPRTEFAHQQVVTAGGEVFEVHAERGGHWVLDAIPEDLAPPNDKDDAATRAG